MFRDKSGSPLTFIRSYFFFLRGGFHTIGIKLISVNLNFQRDKYIEKVQLERGNLKNFPSS